MPPDPTTMQNNIDAFSNGHPGAEDRLCRSLSPIVRREVARILGDADLDVDDVVQESLLASLRYLEARDGFSGDLIKLAVTIARNRCRNILRQRAARPGVAVESLESWLADPARSVLDLVVEDERRTIIRHALDRLPHPCRALLRALYNRGITPMQARSIIGVSSVQGVYHRRRTCLEALKKLVQRRLRFGSWGDGINNGESGKDDS